MNKGPLHGPSRFSSRLTLPHTLSRSRLSSFSTPFFSFFSFFLSPSIIYVLAFIAIAPPCNTSCTVKLKVKFSLIFLVERKMNHWAVQPNAFAAGGDLRSSVSVVERDQTVVCPKPRRIGFRNPAVQEQHHPLRSLRCYFSHQVELCESKAETDILDIILTKDGYGAEQVHTQVIDSPSPFLCGSPPSRVANPLTQDARFRDEITVVSSPPLGPPPSSPSSSGRKGGCIRGNFGNSPAVRIEGFDCLDRDSRNCSIPALA